MTTVEDRLRAAAWAVTQAVPEGSAPPLRLPARRPVASVTRVVGVVLRRIRTLLTPLGAATAVLGAVAVPLTLPGLFQADASGVIAIGPEGTPPYYVAITSGRKPGSNTMAVVGSTASGRLLARVSPPRPYASFVSVTGAASSRSFVLTAEAGQAQGLFLLRFDPASDAAPLSALPIRVPRGVTFAQTALSPDGRQLAVVESAGVQEQIGVYSVASGAGRAWNLADLMPGELSFLSWSANGRQVMYGQRAGPAAYVGLLDPGAAAARPVVSAEVRLPLQLPRGVTSLVMSPNGDLLAATSTSAASASVGGPPGWAVTEYPIGNWRPRQLASVPASAGPAGPSILWANATGSTLIVAPASDQIGVISNGLYSALPSGILGSDVSRYGVSWS